MVIINICNTIFDYSMVLPRLAPNEVIAGQDQERKKSQQPPLTTRPLWRALSWLPIIRYFPPKFILGGQLSPLFFPALWLAPCCFIPPMVICGHQKDSHSLMSLKSVGTEVESLRKRFLRGFATFRRRFFWTPEGENAANSSFGFCGLNGHTNAG